jgi:hypothetical protein
MEHFHDLRLVLLLEGNGFDASITIPFVNNYISEIVFEHMEH